MTIQLHHLPVSKISFVIIKWASPPKADISMHLYIFLSVAFHNSKNQSYDFYSRSNKDQLSHNATNNSEAPGHFRIPFSNGQFTLRGLVGEGDCEAQSSNAITINNWNVYGHISTTWLLWLEFWRLWQASIVKCVTRWDLVFNSSWENCPCFIFS